MSDIRFGTDGWRGRIGDDYTYANVRRAAQGYATYLLAAGGTGPVIVGHDRRFSAEHFAAVACEVLAGNGLPRIADAWAHAYPRNLLQR